jgi:ankyrin repeat protein
MSTTFLTGVDDGGGPASPLGQSWGSSDMGDSSFSSSYSSSTTTAPARPGPGPLPSLDESRREDWVRLQAEKQAAHIVVPKSGLAVSTPIYFGTRRCTLSDVLCIVTTTELLAPSALDRDLALLAARTTPSGVATGEGSAVSSVADPRFASPLYPVGDLSSDERLRRNKALWKEQRTFMSALKAQRKLRIDAEDRGAAALQRMWRGFQLRRWLKTQAKKMKTRKRMKRSYAKIALKIRMQKEMEDNLRKAEQRREDAADLIAATFRMFVGYACSVKERKMRSDEVRRWGATMVQSMVRQRAARRRLVRRRMRAREHQLQGAAVRFQSVWRRHAAVRRVHGVRARLERVAVVWVQRWYRRRMAVKVTSSLRAKALSNKLSTSALVVQRHWRGIQGRRKAYFKQHAVEAELLEAAALAVQCAFRGLMARTRVARRRHRRRFEDRLRASVRIQTFSRSRAGRELYQDEVDRQESDIWIQIKLGNVVAVEDLFKGFGTSEVHTSESTDEDGNTILCAAAKWGHKRLIRRGLKWMCDINHYNDDGLTAVELAVMNDHEKCAEYLIDHEAEVTKFGRTLLHEAAARDMPSVAESLLARNVPAHSEDTDSRTPLHEACVAASDKVVRTLIDRGAALDVQCVSTGRTPIHEAALSGDKAPSQRIVTMLMDAGARIDLKDTQGKTPWRAALTQNNQAVAKILRKSMRGKFDKEETALQAQSSGISKEDQEAALDLARKGDLPGLETK